MPVYAAPSLCVCVYLCITLQLSLLMLQLCEVLYAYDCKLTPQLLLLMLQPLMQQGEDGQAALRRILAAYALHNPGVQSC
jgi:hypothetical protein